MARRAVARQYPLQYTGARQQKPDDRRAVRMSQRAAPASQGPGLRGWIGGMNRKFGSVLHFSDPLRIRYS